MQVMHGIFAKQMLNCCERQQLLALADSLRDGEPPNSMNKYGVILDSTEARRLTRDLQTRFVEPIASTFYGMRLKRQPYGFVVEYEHPGKQKSLAKHFDSSDMTLNICLETQSCRGGDLVFYDDEDIAVGEYHHRQGFGIVHRGSLVHRAKPITRGYRANLILWCAAKAR